MTPRAAQAKAGFTLLEALIALAIAAVCLIPIFGLQQSLVDGQRRHELALRRAEIQRNALVLLRDVNPTVQPEGEISLPPDLTVSWTSTAVSDLATSAGFPVGDGPFNVQLFRLDARVTKGQAEVVAPFSVERMGWELPTEAVTGGSGGGAGGGGGGLGGGGAGGGGGLGGGGGGGGGRGGAVGGRGG